jgi:hypothetical protein
MERRNRYLEGMEDRQKTPRGHPKFYSYMKNLPFWYAGQTDVEINPVWVG